MKYIDLIQRLQRNPDEAVIVYHDLPGEMAWIVDRKGILQHRRDVNNALTDALAAGMMRWIASMVPSRAMLFRPVSDFTEATSA